MYTSYSWSYQKLDSFAKDKLWPLNRFWANTILPYMWGPTLKLEEGLKTFAHRLTRRWAKKYWGLLFTIRVKVIKLTRSVFTTVFWHVANSLDLLIQRGRGRVRRALHVQCVGPVTELGVAFNCLPSTGRKSADAVRCRCAAPRSRDLSWIKVWTHQSETLSVFAGSVVNLYVLVYCQQITSTCTGKITMK